MNHHAYIHLIAHSAAGLFKDQASLARPLTLRLS
jgi:hypothetical protein